MALTVLCAISMSLTCALALTTCHFSFCQEWLSLLFRPSPKSLPGLFPASSTEYAMLLLQIFLPAFLECQELADSHPAPPHLSHSLNAANQLIHSTLKVCVGGSRKILGPQRLPITDRGIETTTFSLPFYSIFRNLGSNSFVIYSGANS